MGESSFLTQPSDMAKSGDEVERQLKNMISFILAEADEKAKEINVRAEEEFNIEKTSIVQEEKKRINEEYAQRMKLVEVEKKIAYSNQLNQSRLGSLKARETSIQNILGETQGRLNGLTQDKEQYKALLGDLIVQALLKMREQEIVVICRAEDDDLVKAAIPGAVDRFQEKTGISAKITVEQKARLAPGAKPNAPKGQPSW